MIAEDSVKLRFIAICPEDELNLLEEFIYELTMAGATICCGKIFSRYELLNGLKQINEINLRVLNIILQIQNGEHWPNKYSTWDMICNRVKRAPYIEGWVETAMIRSLQTLKDKIRVRQDTIH